MPELEKRWKRYALPVGNSWRVDETYIKVRGQWVYLYRAVDKEGRTHPFAIPEGKRSPVTKVWKKVIEGGEIQSIQIFENRFQMHRIQT